MKAAFCTNVFESKDMFEALKILKEIGYDGVEFWDSYLIETDIDTLKSFLTEIDLDVAQICPYFNVTGTREELQNTYKIAEMYVKFAVKLGCKNIRVFTGNVSSREATGEIYVQAVEGLRHICDMGRRDGLFFVLETHDGSLMDTANATLKLLKDVDRDNLKVNLQVPLDYGKEDIYRSAELLGRYVVHLHAHNWIEKWANLTFLSDGDCDFKKFITILAGKGFDGYISIEHGNHSGKQPFEIARHEIGYIKGIIAKPAL